MQELQEKSLGLAPLQGQDVRLYEPASGTDFLLHLLHQKTTNFDRDLI